MQFPAKKSAISCAIAFLSLSSAAQAADIVTEQPYAAPRIEERAGPWQVRARVLTVIPKDGGSVHAAGLGKLADTGLGFSNSVTPEVDFSYFFTKNIAAELILGTTRTKISGKGATMKSLGLGRRLGKTWILPPTLTLQYHITNFGKFQPYIGGGVNYTFFYNEGNWALDNVTVDGTWGGALQFGVDYMFTKHWGFNIDAKKLWLNTSYHARLKGNTILGAAGDGTRITGRAKLDPWLLGAGITYRF
ncbi:MAG: OmpW family protein [Candidatus Tokpelaia sp.]|nr:MAG: OmpW family protein [Candidatus Tokpelaia sp.]KAA6207473.1 MAG: OmpW family protein [Candidatus Tokpelaia sp.]